MTALGRCAALLALLIGACQTTHSVSFRTSQIDDARVEVSALAFRPQGPGPFPAVVLLHTCGGPLPHVTRDWPDFLTGLGFYVLSVSSYLPRGYSHTCGNSQPGWQVGQASDAYGALAYLRTLPEVDADRVAVMGFSAGGIAINASLVTARRVWNVSHDFAAAIAVYANCGYLVSNYGEQDIPLMQIVAGEDIAYRGLCEHVGDITPAEVHVIEGAYHGFDQPQLTSMRTVSGFNMLYSDPATRKAQDLTRAFLARHLK